MRKSPALLLAATALALPACGDDDEGADTTRTGGSATDVPTVTMPPPTTSTSTESYRRPASGEAQLEVTGTVRNAALRRTSDEPSDLAQYQYFVIVDEQGPPLRVAAAGDLALPPAAREKLFDAACENKVRARFKVAPAGRPSDYDYELLEASVLKDDCAKGGGGSPEPSGSGY